VAARGGGGAGDAELEWLALSQPGSPHGTTLVRSFATERRRAAVGVPGTGQALVTAIDHTGRLLARHPATTTNATTNGATTNGATTNGAGAVSVEVPPGGFVIIRR
jgi:hypothetical protein